MENDLISRSALLKRQRRYTEFDEAGFSMTVNAVEVEEIQKAPAVDAVPVVRCGECARRVYKEINDCEIGGCELFGVALPCNFYCAEGERRAEDGK